MFLFQPSLYLSELAKFEPDVSAATDVAFKQSSAEANVRRPAREAWERAPKISIDNAVAERTDRAAIVPIDLTWSDIGSWDALWEIAPQDEAGNALIGDIAAIDVTNSYIRSGDRLVALVGVKDLVVIDTGDVLAIAPRGRTEDVKKLVEALQAQGRKDVL
jgi:mannose-1-phosphate guanylyltransferase/mannose-6-phosphate isomerase